MESAGNIADSLIVTIVQLLTDRRKFGEHYRIELELDRNSDLDSSCNSDVRTHAATSKSDAQRGSDGESCL